MRRASVTSRPRRRIPTRIPTRLGRSSTASTLRPSTAGTAANGSDGDQSVDHYEHTSEPGVEPSVAIERDEDGEVVRDEQYEQPRGDR